jgi:hypothetical protein
MNQASTFSKGDTMNRFGMKSKFTAVAVSVFCLAGASFAQWSRTSPNVYLTTSTDKVGIGNSNPFNKLDVSGTLGLRDNDLLLRGTSGQDLGHGLGWYGTGKTWNGIALDGPALYGYSAGVLGTNRGGTRTNILYWTQTAVGIGTTTPGSKLQVNGNAAIGYSASTAAPANGLLVNGAVGIGTTTVGSYKLAVEGKVGAREVVVTLNTWSDFVFKDGYKLKSLDQVADYVKKNKHLEGIPTETEVKMNGVPIGDMQAKLLQKLEETTLYLIQMKKENDELKAKVCALETAVKGK